MNTIITERTNPNVRHKIQGIYLCEKLNKHMKWKKKFGSNFLIYYLIFRVIKYVYYYRLQQKTSSEIWGRVTAII
jgi:hypothetical protein